MVGESQDTVTVGGGSGSSSNKMPTLEEYGTNLTTQATEVRPVLHTISCGRKTLAVAPAMLEHAHWSELFVADSISCLASAHHGCCSAVCIICSD